MVHNRVESLVATDVRGYCPRGGTTLIDLVLSTAAGAAVGLVEPYYKGYRVLCYNLSFVTRYDRWYHAVINFVIYCLIAFFLALVVFKAQDWFQFALVAWLAVGYATARTSLAAFAPPQPPSRN